MMNNDNNIDIYQIMSKLKQMFDADDNACRALEAHNRGEVPYDEYEINREVYDMLFRELKENINTFSKLSCTDCKLFDDCVKSQKYLNSFCGSFTTEYKKIPKDTMDNNGNSCKNTLTPTAVRKEYCNIKIDTGIFTPECVDLLLRAGFYVEDIENDWDDIPYIIVNENVVIACNSPRFFRNCTNKEVHISEILSIELIDDTNEFEHKIDNSAYVFDIEDIEYIRTQLLDIVEFMKSKHQGKTVVINGDGVSIIPVVMPIYTPTDKSSLILDKSFANYTDTIDYNNTEIKG